MNTSHLSCYGLWIYKIKKILDLYVDQPIKVDKFIEKPDEKTAKYLINDKKYSWNSGMFVFKATVILDEIKKFAPDLLKNCEKCLEKSKVDLDFLRLEEKSFKKCENTSIDVSVFEKTKKAFVIPLIVVGMT